MNRLLFFILFNVSFAQELIPYVSPTLEKPYNEQKPDITIPQLEEVPSIKHYEDFLLLLKNNSENFSNLEFYNKVQIKINNEIKKIKDFDETTINLFFIYQGEALSDTMMALQKLWENQIENSKDELKKKQLIKYSEILLNIRKDHAVYLEKEVERIMGETEIPEDEKSNHIEKIKDWNTLNLLKKE